MWNRPTKWICLGFLTLALGRGFPASAQDPDELITDRPDQTESAVTIVPGSVQLETGGLYLRDDEDGVRTELLEVPGTLVRIGLAERLELRLGWSGWSDFEVEGQGFEGSVDGVGDADVGVKIRLRDEAGGVPEMALLVTTSVPVGDEAFSSERFDPELRLSVAHTLSERLGLGWNVGAAWESEPAEDGLSERGRTTRSRLFYTVALGIGLGDRVGAFVELFGDVAGSAAGGPAHSFDGGFTFLLRPNVQFDVAVGVGLSEAADDAFIGLGLSVRWPR